MRYYQHNKIVNKIFNSNNKNKIRDKIIIILLSFFLSFFTISKFLPSAGRRTIYNIYFIFPILIIVYYFIFKKVLIWYKQLIMLLIKKYNKTQLKNINEYIPLTWLISSIIGSVTSFILFIIFSYYIHLEISVLGNLNDYRLIALEIYNNLYPLIITIFIIIGIIFQIYFLIKKEKVKFKSAFFVSLIVILLFSFIMYIIRNIIVLILAWL